MLQQCAQLQDVNNGCASYSGLLSPQMSLTNRTRRNCRHQAWPRTTQLQHKTSPGMLPWSRLPRSRAKLVRPLVALLEVLPTLLSLSTHLLVGDDGSGWSSAMLAGRPAWQLFHRIFLKYSQSTSKAHAKAAILIVHFPVRADTLLGESLMMPWQPCRGQAIAFEPCD